MKHRLALVRKIRTSISGKILVAILLISTAVTVVTTMIETRYDYKTDVGQIQQNLDLIRTTHLKAISEAIWDYNTDQLKTELESLRSIPGVDSVLVQDPSGKTLESIGGFQVRHPLKIEYPLTYRHNDKNENLGRIKIYASLESVYNRLYEKLFLIFFAQLFKTVVVSFLVFWAVHRIIARHLVHITEHVRDFNFKRRLQLLKLDRKTHDLESADELDILVQTINIMTAKLHDTYIELNYFNKQLAKRVAEETRTVLEQRQKLEFASKMSSLGEMAGGIAHEINTPLAVIKQKAELAQEMLDDEPMDRDLIRQFLGDVGATVERIAKIVRGLRGISRNGSKDAFQIVNVQSMIDDTLSLCQERVKNNSIDLRIPNIPSDLMIECRSVEISQLLLNLINNSVDAIHSAAQKWIQIELLDIGEFIEIHVTDSGPGIPPELAEKVMQPFFTTKDVGKGTGLGLSISRTIVENHGGAFYLDQKCQNTRFVVKLPKRQSAQSSAA